MNYGDKRNPLVDWGDLLVVHLSDKERYVFRIEAKAVLQTKFGIVKACELVDKPYGKRFDCSKGWVLPLRLTTEYWTHLLKHRTQVLYHADVSMILLQLDIKPGSIVVEAGTGSGSLSHAILRAIQPNGYLYTFDNDTRRLSCAASEFREHGYRNLVSTFLRDVCDEGFPPRLEGKADAVILDLPQTWNAIKSAHKLLKPSGARFCTFSPCIEQVQQNVAKMNKLKMKDITTLECLERPFEMRTQNFRVWSKETLEELVQMDEEKMTSLKECLHKRKQARLEPTVADTAGTAAASAAAPPSVATEDSPAGQSATTSGAPDLTASTSTARPAAAVETSASQPAPNICKILPTERVVFPRQCERMMGHTGFLTFASRRP